MSEKNPTKKSTENKHKRSYVEFYLNKGIPSCNTTQKHLNETTLIFVKISNKNTVETKIDDSIETLIRNLNIRK